VFSESHRQGHVYREQEGHWQPLELPLNPRDVVVSSDGSLIAFTAIESGGQASIYVHDLSRGTTTRVATQGRVFAMSHDRSWLLLMDLSAGGKTPRFRLVSLRGQPERLLNTTGLGWLNGGTITVLPDGRVLAPSCDEAGNYRVAMLDGQAPPRIMKGLPPDCLWIIPINPGLVIAESNEDGIHRARSFEGPWEKLSALKGKSIFGWDPASGDLVLTARSALAPLDPPAPTTDYRPRSLPRWRFNPVSGRLTPLPALPPLSTRSLILSFVNGGCTLPGKAIQMDLATTGCLFLVDGVLPH
jgi:WD40 repeat protein